MKRRNFMKLVGAVLIAPSLPKPDMAGVVDNEATFEADPNSLFMKMRFPFTCNGTEDPICFTTMTA